MPLHSTAVLNTTSERHFLTVVSVENRLLLFAFYRYASYFTGASCSSGYRGFFHHFLFSLFPLKGTSQHLPETPALVYVIDKVDKEINGAGKVTLQSMYCVPSFIYSVKSQMSHYKRVTAFCKVDKSSVNV